MLNDVLYDFGGFGNSSALSLDLREGFKWIKLSVDQYDFEGHAYIDATVLCGKILVFDNFSGTHLCVLDHHVRGSQIMEH